jgi:L,D-peptidoglycan transpeptidase YkuD (ErfK/YbiS/YcfS/YnhG family)
VATIALAVAYVRATRADARWTDTATAVTNAPAASTVAVTPTAVAPTPAAGLFSRTPTAKPTPTRTRTPARSAARPDNVASRLRALPAATRQVVVVSATGYGISEATLQTFSKRDTAWQPALGAMPARIGTKGFRDSKVEGDLTTPTGVYGIGSTMYGIAANPGVRYAYHRLVADDWWNENPDSPGYNSFWHGADPGGASEALWQISPQYRYFSVITYNIPVRTADPPRGSGIFLHVMVSGRSTAGCVALAEADLLRVLRWLDPAASPRIVMAPEGQLDRY